MIISMKMHATPARNRRGAGAGRALRLQGALDRGRGARRDRSRRSGRCDCMPGVGGGHAASREGGADFRAVQICEQTIQAGAHADRVNGVGNRRRRIRRDGGAVLGRVGEANHGGGRRRGQGRRENAARRRVQAADVAVRFPGHGRRRAEAAAEGERGDRPRRSSPK